jgi:nucleoside phosphorylase
MPTIRTLSKDEYTVGWICALPFEMAAAVVMLDEIHEDLQEQDTSDHNSYKLGRIQNHNVVIACLPAGIYGTNPAANVSKDMVRTFRSIRFSLMVGIGGGAPSATNDVRLGDVVVSQPSGTNGGVIQYDRGKTVQGGEFRRTGALNSPPMVLLTTLGRMQAEHEYKTSKVPIYLSEMMERHPKMRGSYTYPGAMNDHLYQATYDHAPNATTCENCDSSREVIRDPRNNTELMIHYGNIASGNQVIKHGATRDQLQKEFDVLCFEMEASGLMLDFPCLVVRGICDYADSHKNKIWQKYAAATATAFAKELLHFTSAEQVCKEKPIMQVSGK